MTLQTYNKIKYVYNGVVSVELDYSQKYEVGDIYHFKDDYECKGIIKRIRSCPHYGKGTIFAIIEMI